MLPIPTSSLILFAGGFVESMYIATQSAQNGNTDKLTHRLSEQIVTLNSIVHLLNDEKEKSDNVKKLIVLMTKIQTSFANCAAHKAQLATLEEGEEPISFSITEDEMVKITAEVAAARNEITSNN